ncbi:MAG: hypothetical protein IPM21_16220 [Acidobacteria bacterium]|nr:hypothetical protein [Acidobacteriota bacterium]
MKNLKNLMLVLGLAIGLGLACGGGDPVPQAYQGDWIGTDGSTIYMYGDGKAGFKVGGKSVDGGGAEIDNAAKTLTISLFGISQTWKIDEEPADGEMKLSGVVYRRN